MSKRNQKLRLCAAHMPLIRHSISSDGEKSNELIRSLSMASVETKRRLERIYGGASGASGESIDSILAGAQETDERIEQAPMWFASHDMGVLAVDTAINGGAPMGTRLPSENGIIGFDGGLHINGAPPALADISVVYWDNQSKWKHSEDGTMYVDIMTFSNSRAAHALYTHGGAPEFVQVHPGILQHGSIDNKSVVEWGGIFEMILLALFALEPIRTVASVRDYKTHPLDRVPRKYDPDLPSNRVRLVDVRENLTEPGGRDGDQADGKDGGKRREYAYRFIVRGFYRNQPYGPGHKLRRRQWIPPFVKGPADKPLRVNDTVNILRGTVRQEGQQEHE